MCSFLVKVLVAQIVVNELVYSCAAFQSYHVENWKLMLRVHLKDIGTGLLGGRKVLYAAEYVTMRLDAVEIDACCG